MLYPSDMRLKPLSLPHLFAIAILLPSCSTRQDAATEASLKAAAEEMAAQDMPLSRPLDMSAPAIIETSYPDAKSPSCNGYCLRLLYSGEARTVISGFAVTPRAQNLNFNDDKWASTGPDTPETLKGLQVMAFHLESRDSCPDAPHHETRDFHPENSSQMAQRQFADKMADFQIGNGNCLIATAASLSDASTVLIFSDEYRAGYEQQGRSDSHVIATHLTIYENSNGAFDRIYRHTRVITNYLPEAMAWLDGLGYSGRTTEWEKRAWPNIMRADLGLEIAELTPLEGSQVRVTIDRLLADDRIDASSNQWNAVTTYLDGLAASKQVSEDDIALIGRIVADPRLDRELAPLPNVLRYSHPINSPLARPLLEAILATPLPRGGLNHPEDLNRTRLEWLADAMVHIPEDAVRSNEELVLRIATDPYRRAAVPRVLYLVGYLAPSRAFPVAMQLSYDPNEVVQQGAMSAFCRMGKDARPAQARIVEIIRANQGAENGVYTSAWRALVGMDAVEAVAKQLPPDRRTRGYVEGWERAKARGRNMC